MNTRKKTIFISVHQGFAVRYLLRSNIFRILQHQQNIHIVIHSPYSNKDYFKNEFNHENVSLEYFNLVKAKQDIAKKKAFYTFNLLRSYGIDSSTLVGLRRKVMIRKMKSDSVLKFFYALALDGYLRLMRKCKALRNIMIAFDKRLFPGIPLDDVFKKWRPDLLIVCSPGFFVPDILVMRRAKRYNIKTLSVVLSWDNPTTKGLPGADFDYCVVWTDKMKRELKELYGIPDNKLFVSGIAHFDNYYDYEKLYTKREVQARFGIQQNKRIIFYGMGFPKRFHKENLKLAKILAEENVKGSFGDNVEIIVRPHPNYFHRSEWGTDEITARFFNEFNGFKKFALFMPLFKMENVAELDLDNDDQKLLASVIRQSDVICCFFSTLNIEAAIFDKPVVNISFQDYFIEDINAMMSDARKYEHNNRIVESGGVQVADNEAHMIKLINRYLENPSLESAGRKNLRKMECGPNPGRASQEFVEYVMSVIP